MKKDDSELTHSFQPSPSPTSQSTGPVDIASVSQQETLTFSYLVTLIRSIDALHSRAQWQDEQEALENLRENKPNGLWEVSTIKMPVELQIIAWL